MLESSDELPYIRCRRDGTQAISNPPDCFNFELHERVVCYDHALRLPDGLDGRFSVDRSGKVRCRMEDSPVTVCPRLERETCVKMPLDAFS